MEGTMRQLTEKDWKILAPLLPKDPLHPKGGRPFVSNRKVLSGIWFIVSSGIPWNDLPKRYGSGATCWRRLRRWQKDGTWQRLWEGVLKILDAQDRIDWEHSALDSTDIPAKKGGAALAGRANSSTWPRSVTA